MDVGGVVKRPLDFAGGVKRLLWRVWLDMMAAFCRTGISDLRSQGAPSPARIHSRADSIAFDALSAMVPGRTVAEWR